MFGVVVPVRRDIAPALATIARHQHGTEFADCDRIVPGIEMHGKQTAFAAAVDWRPFSVVQTRHQTFLTHLPRMSATRGDTVQRQWLWPRRHCFPACAAASCFQDFLAGVRAVRGFPVVTKPETRYEERRVRKKRAFIV